MGSLSSAAHPTTALTARSLLLLPTSSLTPCKLLPPTSSCAPSSTSVRGYYTLVFILLTNFSIYSTAAGLWFRSFTERT